MNKKTIAKIDKLIQAQNEAKAALNQRIEQAQADIEKANKAMEKATATDNEAEYIKAADKKRFNENVISSCEQKIEDLKKATSEQEYNDIINEIKADAAKEIDDTEKTAADIIADLYKTIHALEREIHDYNNLLQRWADANGSTIPGIEYAAFKHELPALKIEIQKRKTAAFHTGRNGSIYAKIPAIDID